MLSTCIYLKCTNRQIYISESVETHVGNVGLLYRRKGGEKILLAGFAEEWRPALTDRTCMLSSINHVINSLITVQTEYAVRGACF